MYIAMRAFALLAMTYLLPPLSRRAILAELTKKYIIKSVMTIPSASDLVYFAEVASKQNLSHAAKALNISQPSLTLAMQRLEEALGTPILIRHQRGVSLTKAGQKLLAHTKELQQTWNVIKTGALACTNNIQGTVSIGCHPSVAIYSLHRFLPQLLVDYPTLNVRLQHDLSKRITDDIIRLNLDIGIVVNPVEHPDIVIKPLASDRVGLWRMPNPSATQDLTSGDAVIICDPDISQTQAVLKAIKRDGVQYGRMIESNNLEVIADLAECGAGIAVLPGNIARQRELKCIKDTPYFTDEICCIYRGENRHVASIQAIVEAIKAGFATQTTVEKIAS